MLQLLNSMKQQLRVMLYIAKPGGTFRDTKKCNLELKQGLRVIVSAPVEEVNM